MTGHLKQRSDGAWSLVLYLGRDHTGKKKYRWITFKGTRREAQRELNRLLHELDAGELADAGRITVAQFLEQWLKHTQPTVAPKTYETYAMFVAKHLAPRLGHHKLAKLSPLHIQSYYTQALIDGRADGAGGLSRRTVLHHHHVLREALRMAVKWQLIPRNPAEAVEPPKPPKRPRSVLNPEQMRTLLSEARAGWVYVPILIAIATGLRRGEVLALRWADVDLDACRLNVNQALEQTRTAGLRFKEPKSEAGLRPVTLPAFLVRELRRHKGRQSQIRLTAETLWHDHDLIICHDDGRPRTPDNLTHAFTKLMERVAAQAELPRVTFHDLRHCHATLLFLMGENPKVVSERLGHAGTQITQDLYGHVLPTMQRGAATKLDEAFGELGM